MPSITPRLVCVAFALAVSAGCGGPANQYDAVVTGTVTIDGELAKSGTVIFHPVEKGGLFAVGQIFPDGSYSLRTGQGDLSDVDGGTVQSGDYIVTAKINAPSAEGQVVAEGGPPVPGPSLIAKKYALKETSDLRRTVKPGPNVFVLQLERAEIEPIDSDEDATQEESGEEGTAEEANVEEASDADASSDGASTPAADGPDKPELDRAATEGTASSEDAGADEKAISLSAETSGP